MPPHEAVRPVRVAVLGTGVIATADNGVLPNIRYLGGKVEVVATADTVPGRAKEVADRFGIAESFSSLGELLENCDAEAVVNLTPIPAHADTSLEIVEAGRHLVTEKPLATSIEDANAIIDAARRSGVIAVCSPPNMLYPSRQEMRRLVRAGVVGRVAFARARASNPGPAAMGFPLDPTWFYQAGSGPLFDVGVYGVHELTGILGPAQRVVAFSGITDRQRRVKGGPFDGQVIDVNVEDNTLMLLDFGQSVFATLDATFNVHATRAPRMEIFGRGGTLVMHYNTIESGPNPHIECYETGAAGGRGGWVVPNLAHLQPAQRHVDLARRALLLEHLADCLRTGRAPELSLERARHELEVMLGAMSSARTGEAVRIESTFDEVDTWS
jgi:predicted dehydrogenase